MSTRGGFADVARHDLRRPVAGSSRGDRQRVVPSTSSLGLGRRTPNPPGQALGTGRRAGVQREKAMRARASSRSSALPGSTNCCCVGRGRSRSASLSQWSGQRLPRRLHLAVPLFSRGDRWTRCPDTCTCRSSYREVAASRAIRYTCRSWNWN